MTDWLDEVLQQAQEDIGQEAQAQPEQLQLRLESVTDSLGEGDARLIITGSYKLVSALFNATIDGLGGKVSSVKMEFN